MNELKIINYILSRLDNFGNGADAISLIAELKTVRDTLTVVPAYYVDKIVDAVFCGVFDNAE